MDYRLPQGVAVSSGQGNSKNETRFSLDGAVILTVIGMPEDFHD
jgi:hypothetical protein